MTTFIHYHNRGAGLPPDTETPDTVVWVPGEQIACHLVTVPPVARKKWQAMVPWLLEERLLEPPENITFGAGDRQPDNQVPVVAVSRDRLGAWRRELADAGLEHATLVPDFFALPWEEGRISLGFIGGRWLARFDRWQGAAGTEALISTLVTARAARDGTEVVIYYDSDKPAFNLAEDVDHSYRQVNDLLVPQHRDWLAIAEGRPTRAGMRWSLPAKVASILAVVLLALGSATAVVENRQVAAQVAYLEGELKRGYRQYFGRPYDFAMADFQRVVSSRLEASGGGGDSPLALLADLSRLLQPCGDCRLEQLSLGGMRVVARISGTEVEPRLSAAVNNDPSASLTREGDSWRLTMEQKRR